MSNCNSGFVKTIMFLSCVFALCLGFNQSIAQKLLQLEVRHEVKAIKFAEGDVILFRSNDLPKEWRKEKIERILIEDGVILFENGMVNVSDITHIRLQNGAAYNMGNLLEKFGLAWLTFGGIAHFTIPTFTFTWTTFAIGSTAAILGYFLRKVVARKTYTIGKNAEIRLIDISFPSSNDVKPAYP